MFMGYGRELEEGNSVEMITFHYIDIYEVLKVKGIVIQHWELSHMNFRISKEQDPCWLFLATSSLSWIHGAAHPSEKMSPPPRDFKGIIKKVDTSTTVHRSI